MQFDYTLLLFYTDPGSGQLIIQLVLASLFGLLFYVKKIKEKIFGKAKKTETTDQISPEEKVNKE